jgi:outer membrane biosynthesis protein TonB
VNIPLLKQQPTKIIDPVYPQIARQGWIQGKIVLDVLIGKTGAVEKVGCDKYCACLQIP